MVHDAKRNLLYITNGTSVERYDMSTGTLLSPFVLSGSLLGIDLSPNQDRLVVAGGGGFGTGKTGVHVIDLTDGSIDPIAFNVESLEGRTFSPVFTSDSELLVTSTFNGSGWVPLRKVTIATESATSIASVRQNTMLAASAGRDFIAYAENNSSGGPFGIYTPGDGDFDESGTSWFAFEIGVSRNGTQVAVPSYGGTFMYSYDGSFHNLGTIGIYADESPIGLVYSPVRDLVFFAWHDFDDKHPSVDVYETNSLTRVDTIDPTFRYDWEGNGAFQGGRLRISRDGRWLFATVEGSGVNIYDVSTLGVPEPSTIILLGLAAVAGTSLRSRRF